MAAKKKVKLVLTERQRRFVEEYAVDGNATQAAIRAGYAKNSAKQTASDLLTVPDVGLAIAANAKARSDRLGYDADQVMLDLIPLTDANLANFIIVDEDECHLANINDLASMDRDTVKQISSLKITERYDMIGNPIILTEIRLHDPVKAIALLGKHRAVQAFLEKLEVTNSLAATVEELKRRRAG